MPGEPGELVDEGYFWEKARDIGGIVKPQRSASRCNFNGKFARDGVRLD